jgi:zinc finger protein 830
MASKSVDAKTALRQLMKQEKQKRIDSPFAKYTNTGQICCALCNQQLTSENFWKAHVNGREHKQKLLELKSNIKQTNSDAVFAKPFPPSPLTTQPQRGVKRPHDVATSDDYAIVSKPSGPVTTAQHSALPADFFDSGSSKSQVDSNQSVTKSSLPTTNPIPPIENTSAIPEGFFDNPELDARMRKVEYVNKMEIEWDTFTREMKQETNISDKLEAYDDIERDVEREIKETDELITRWQKIEDMHDIKDNRFKIVKERTNKSVKQSKNESDDDDDDDDQDLEKELQSMYNWRQKRS